MALRTRILLLVLLAALLPALVAIAFLLAQRDRQLVDAHRNLAALARNAGSEFEQKLQGTSQLLLGLTQSRVLASPDRTVCSLYLSRVLTQYPQYTGILTIRPDGELHCDSLATGRKLTLTDRSYFRRALVSDTVAIEPVFGRLTGLGVVQVALASRDEHGRVQFVLLASFNIEQFARELAASQPYPGTAVVVLDAKGTLMNRSGHFPADLADTPKNDNDYSRTALHAFVLASRPGETRSLPTALGGSRVWTVVRPAEAGGLTIALGAPQEALGESAARALNVALGVLLLATLLAFAGAWWLSERGIRGPLKRIMSAAGRFSQGNLGARVGAPYPTGEIGSLMRALDAIFAKLQAEEAELRQLHASLEQRVLERTVQLYDLNAELKSFSYSVSHDLRGPLRAIDGFATLVQLESGDRMDETSRANLQRIREAGRRMGELVDGLLALSHITSDERRHATLDLSDMADEISERLRAENPDRNVVFTVAPGVSAYGDAALLRQALENLLGNAWKYTTGRDPAEIAFGVATNAAGFQEYFVADNGAGFDMAYADKLFRPFERLHAESEFPGTGIGLATVRRIVHHHNGQVRAEGTVGGGARFAFTLGTAPAD